MLSVQKMTVPLDAPQRATHSVNVRTFDDLGSLPASYVAFLQQVGRQQFFLGFDWFQNLIATALEPEAKVRIYAVEDGAGAPQVVLCTRTPAGQNGSTLGFPPPRASLASLTNFQTPVFGVCSLSGQPHDPAAFTALTQHLATESPRWSVIDFNYMDQNAPAFRLLVAALRNAGLVVQPYFHCNEWYEQTEGLTYREYLNARSPAAHKAIQNYARKRRKLEKNARLRFALYRSIDIEQPLLDYQRVYAASWKDPEPYPAFVPGLWAAAAKAGGLRMGILYLDEEPVASEVAIVTGGRAAMVKTAYDQRRRDLSVGSIVIASVIEHLLDVDKVSEISFGPFDAPYKAHWVSQTRELHGIAAFDPRTPAGLKSLGRQILSRAIRGSRRVAGRIRRSFSKI
jgi:Acetyltransferase (GNAT) domain